MSSHAVPNSEKVLWEVESLRATFFLGPEQTHDEQRAGWWKEVMGEEPEQTLSQRGIYRYTGRKDATSVSLIVQYGRLDWSLTANIEQTPEILEKIPTIGSFSSCTPSLLEIVERWIALSPPCIRMAFGAVLLYSVPDLKTGNAVLRDLLPKIKIPEESTDFLYQVNLPLQSTVAGNDLMLNRLAKWSVNQIDQMRLLVGSQGPRNPLVSPTWVCRLELDMSTPGHSDSPIPDDKREKIFKELVELGGEIAARGYN